MKKLTLLVALLAIATFAIAQTPKISRKEKRSRNYKGCVTYTDSLIRRVAWETVDSMKARNYIKN